MSEHEGRHDDGGRGEGEPDDALSEYENGEDQDRESLEREAGLTAFGGPSFGHLFDQAPKDDRGFDAEHNP